MFESFILSFISEAYLRAIVISMIIFLCISVSFHIIIFKKDSRAAIGWLIFVISAPVLGALTYIVFGVNNLQRKAVKLDLGVRSVLKKNSFAPDLDPSVKSKLKVGEALTYSPFCALESVIPLDTGDEAYPQMLAAIKSAKSSISLFSYIFNVDPVGQAFIDALGEARKRGVLVCVLVDGVGSQATLRQLALQMKKLKIDFHIFLPVLYRPRLVNMRNHRKILVVDGDVAFTGGLNIGEIYWPHRTTKQTVLDFHFRFEGPIVNYIQAVFADDWFFCSNKILEGPLWFQTIENKTRETGQFSRVVVGGPGLDNEKIQWHFISIINQAKENIRISTPYFLPSRAISAALIAAAQRGVEVDIVTPGKSDSRLISWATEASLHELLRFGCQIWHSAPPFDHSKLFIVDENCLSVGSANWDVRSLRLNFEMNIEIYSKDLATKIIAVFEEKKSTSKLYTIGDYEARSLFTKLRGGLARLASPYL